jgi:glycosyltransferase 2 family protein
MIGHIAHLLGGVWGGIAGASPWLLAIALLLHLAKIAAEARSWHGIVRHAYPPPDRVRFTSTLAAFVASIGANAVLPARIGEGLRVGIMRRAVPGSSVAVISATVALEVLVEVVFGIVILAVWVVAGGSVGVGGVGHRLSSLIVSPVALAAIAGAGAAATLLALALRGRTRRLLAHLARGFSIVRSGRVFARTVLGWKLVAWVLRFASVLAFLAAFHLPAAPWIALVVLAAQTAAGTIPLLPGNAGTQQAAISLALAGTATTAASLGFGVGLQAATTVADLAIGALAVALVARRAGGGLGELRTVTAAP